MSNLLDDCMDDNPIDEDFSGNGTECSVCGELTTHESGFCSEKCYDEFHEEL